MTISENDRLDLRRALETALGDHRLAAIAMEAMPPLDYDQLATSGDLRILTAELRGEMTELRAEFRGEMVELRGEMTELRAEFRGEMAELRGEMAELRGEMAELRAEIRGGMAELGGGLLNSRGEVAAEFAKVRTEVTTNLRLMLAGQLATTMMLGAWVVAVT
ncbi:MAG: hypothetical protein ACFCVK_01070 [Acidimicrobiales bacterium]